MKRPSRAISPGTRGGGEGEGIVVPRLDELTDRRSFWENFSKMRQVAATATEHMRDL